MTGETAEASWRAQHGGGWQRIYRKHWLRRVLLTIISAAVILAVMAAIALVVQSNVGPLPESKIAGVIALCGGALVVLGLLGVELTYKITLTEDSIAASWWGWQRVLARADIAGCREARGTRNRRLLVIFPIDPQAKPLRLHADLATDAAFEAWIAGLRDLNVEDLMASAAEIAGDRRYGATPQARLNRLARARYMMKWANAAAIAAAVLCLIEPWPYFAAISVAAILPVLALIVVAATGGLVRFARLPTEAHVGAAIVPVVCTAALALRVYWDVHLIDGNSALKIGGVAGFMLFALAVILDRSLIRHILRLVIAAFVAVVYGIAVVVLADVHLDRSPGQDFRSPMLDSRVNRGRLTTYSVRLAPWGPWQRAGEVSVPEALFNQLKLSKMACIRLYDGAFGIPWFSVAACAPEASNSTGPFNRFNQVAPGTNPFGPPPLLCPPGQEPASSGSPPSLVCRSLRSSQ